MATKTHVFQVEGQHPVTLLVKPASFQVVYGASSKDSLDYDGAALELGHCLMHALACNGLMNENREYGIGGDPYLGDPDAAEPAGQEMTRAADIALVQATLPEAKGEHQVPGPNSTEVLEGMIDKFGMFEVLMILDTLCSDKAAHIRANGNRSDNYLARRWEGAAKACRRAAGSKAVEYVDPSYPT